MQDDIEKFLYREVRLLDERRFEEWTDLFAEDGYYWVPAYPNQNDPYKAVSIFFDDKDLMRTRLSRLDHPKVHAQKPPSRTVHIVSNIEIDKNHKTAGEVLIHSALQGPLQNARAEGAGQFHIVLDQLRAWMQREKP